MLRHFATRLKAYEKDNPAEDMPVFISAPRGLVKKNSFIHPHIQTIEKVDGGKGVVATAPIKKGEIVCIFVGDIMTLEEVQALPIEFQCKTLQLAPNVYLAYQNPFDESKFDESDYFNHSCDPNLYFTGNNVLVAARNIRPGEELCYDYGTTDTFGNPDTLARWACKCGSKNCRGQNDPEAYHHLVPKYGLEYVAYYIAELWKKRNGTKF